MGDCFRMFFLQPLKKQGIPTLHLNLPRQAKKPHRDGVGRDDGPQAFFFRLVILFALRNNELDSKTGETWGDCHPEQVPDSPYKNLEFRTSLTANQERREGSLFS